MDTSKVKVLYRVIRNLVVADHTGYTIAQQAYAYISSCHSIPSDSIVIAQCRAKRGNGGGGTIYEYACMVGGKGAGKVGVDDTSEIVLLSASLSNCTPKP